MKIIDAVWEKRNLGMNVQEILIESSDTENLFNEYKKTLTASYQVLKIPVEKKEFMILAKKEGFEFVEMQFHSYGMLDIAASIASDKKLQKQNIYCKKVKSDIIFNKVIELVKLGIFTTDRIALDKSFGIEVSNRRYANWINDLRIKQDTDLRVVYFNEELIGFLIGTVSGNCYKALLGGVIPKYQGFLGFYVFGAIFRELAAEYKFLDVEYSSNNMPIVKLYQFFNFPIKQLSYVYTKHRSK